MKNHRGEYLTSTSDRKSFSFQAGGLSVEFRLDQVLVLAGLWDGGKIHEETIKLQEKYHLYPITPTNFIIRSLLG
jgi:hypothetical protein